MDRRGFYLPPADLHWGLAGVPEQLETDSEECYWEIEKFIRLGLKANPNILECLYSPLVETCTPLAAQLIEMRHIFLSRHIHRTYNSYVLSQFKKLEQDLRNEHGIRWKHVMHLIRLLLSGGAILKDGFVPVRVDEHRERLLAVRRGEVSWEEVEEWRLRLHRELDQMLETTCLPEHPDYGRANEFLLRARRYATSKEYWSVIGPRTTENGSDCSSLPTLVRNRERGASVRVPIAGFRLRYAWCACPARKGIGGIAAEKRNDRNRRSARRSRVGPGNARHS